MTTITYKIDIPKNFSIDEREKIRDLLEQQEKVDNPNIEKVNRCSLLCICQVDNEIVSIGAIKPKTNSDFNTDKADLDKLRNDFDLELGYCFTLSEHTGQGYSSNIARMLIDKIGNINLMGSTELRSDNSMIRILERNGFNQYGKPWKSGIHNGTLGLFLKFTE